MADQRRIIENPSTGERMIWDNGKTYPVPEGAGYKGSILPFSNDEFGDTHFDINAGIPGALIDAFTLPGDVLTGKVRPDMDNPEFAERAVGLATTITPLPAATRAGQAVMGGALKMRPVNPAAPSAEALYKAGDAAYTQARGMGVDYTADSIASLSNGLRQSLDAEGFIPVNAPKTAAILDQLRNPPAGAVASTDNILGLRKALQKVAGNYADAQDQAAASIAIKRLDEFLENPTAESVVARPAAAEGVVGQGSETLPAIPGEAGNARAAIGTDPEAFIRAKNASTLLKQGRGNIAAAKRSERLTGMEEKAELRAISSNSGKNAGNNIKNRLTDIITTPGKARGYSDAELARMESIIRNTGNRTRNLSNRLGGGGGAAQFGVASVGGAVGAGIGSFFGGPIGAAMGGAAGATIPPAIGAGARSVYNSMVQKAVGGLDEMIRQRSPLFEQMRKTAQLAPKDAAARSAFIRSLLQLLQADGAEPEARQ